MEKWLRYHHKVPPDDWQQGRGQPLAPQSQLITDFTAYDTSRVRKDVNPKGPCAHPSGIGTHWVGDLAVECVAEIEKPSGTLAFELCKGGRQFQCRFDLATGQATLSISGGDMAEWRPKASTNVRGKGSHKIFFSNCDNELRLWVDGGLVSFDVPTTYRDLRNTQPTDDDLEPVGIALTGAALRISHIRVLRDIYYVADRYRSMGHDVYYDVGNARPGKEHPPAQDSRYVEFELKPDQFFVLGDNSAMSKDARLWSSDYWWVPRNC